MVNTTTPSGSSTESESESPASRFAALSGLAADVGLPLVGYYGLRVAGASEWVALLGATALAGVRLVVVALRSRRVTWFAALMLAVFGLGLALAFVGGDPRFLLLKDSLTTGVVGLVFLASLGAGRPLTLSAFQTWKPDEAAEMEHLYRTAPAARRIFRVSAVVWGVGLLAEAGLRVPLIYVLPLDVAVGASTAMMIVTITALSTWNGIWAGRAQARAQDAASPAPILPSDQRAQPATASY